MLPVQSPALALEFMEISGELLVSFSSGLCCLPTCRWCPLKLLIAIERAERREATPSGTGSGSGSGNTSTGASGVRTTVAPLFESIAAQADATATGEREEGPLAPTEFMLKRPPWRAEPQVPKAGGGRGYIGDHRRQREPGQLIGRREVDNETLRAGRRSGRLAGDVGWKEKERTRAAAEQGPGDAAVGEAPATFRLSGWLAPRAGGCVGDRNKLSILDRMSSKVLSMPGSPPPPTTRATKVRNGETCFRWVVEVPHMS